ncbi:MAG: sugar ABC transporter permease [Trueperaceae bacterium]|nr:MAG: sugar ABC transporter permease [Trueperaceae bacterium]
MAAYLLFLVTPFLRGIWISLHDWNLLAVAINPDAARFVGARNYTRMLWGDGIVWTLDHQWGMRLAGLVAIALIAWWWHRGVIGRGTALAAIGAGLLLFGLLLGLNPADDGRWGDRRFWPIVGNTLTFVALTVPSVTLLGLALALGLNRDDRTSAVLRTAFFLSQVLSVTVVTLIWQLTFSPRQGMLGHAARSLGLDPIQWITNVELAMPAIVIATVWWSLGFAMILFLAGLQEIPAERYEAARLDGAGLWSIIRFITLPALSRTTTLVIVLQIILHFQVFGQSHLITRGGPNDATQVLVRYIYQTGFRNSELGYASALAVVLFLFMLVFAMLQLRVSRGDD